GGRPIASATRRRSIASATGGRSIASTAGGRSIASTALTTPASTTRSPATPIALAHRVSITRSVKPGAIVHGAAGPWNSLRSSLDGGRPSGALRSKSAKHESARAPPEQKPGHEPHRVQGWVHAQILQHDIRDGDRQKGEHKAATMPEPAQRE